MATNDTCHSCGVAKSVAFVHSSKQRACGDCLIGLHLGLGRGRGHGHGHGRGRRKGHHRDRHVLGTNIQNNNNNKSMGGPLDGEFDFDTIPLGLDGLPIVVPPSNTAAAAASGGQEQQQHSLAMPSGVQEFAQMPRINFQWQVVAALVRPLYLLRTQGLKNHYDLAVWQTVDAMRAIFASRPGSFDAGVWSQFGMGVSHIVFQVADDRVQSYALMKRQPGPHCEDAVQREYVSQHIPQIQQAMDALIAQNSGLVPLDTLAAQLVGMYEFYRAALQGSWDAARQEFEQAVTAIATALVYWSIDDEMVSWVVYKIFSEDVLGPRTDRTLSAPTPRLPTLAEDAAYAASGRRTPAFIIESKLVGANSHIEPAFEYTLLSWGIVTYRSRLVIDAMGRYVYEAGQPTTATGRKGFVTGTLEPADKTRFDELWARYARAYSTTRFDTKGTQGGCVVKGPEQPFIVVYSAGRKQLDADADKFERAYQEWSEFGAHVIEEARRALPVNTPTPVSPDDE